MRSNPKRIRQNKKQANQIQQQLIRAILIIGALMLLIIFFFGDHGLYQLYLLRSERSDIQAAITTLREQKETLEAEKNKLTTDSKYIEQLARERFRTAKKGEKVFKVIEKKPEYLRNQKYSKPGLRPFYQYRPALHFSAST